MNSSPVLFFAFLIVILICGGNFKSANAQDGTSKVNSFKMLDRLTISGESMQGLESIPATTSQPDEKPASQITSRRIGSINDRIELLKKLVDEEKSLAEKAITEQANERALNDRKRKLMSPEAHENQTTDGDSHRLNMIDNQTAEPETDVEKFEPSLPIQANSPAPPAGTPVFNQPVDSFELGNSLFLTGSYTASIKSYQDKLNHLKDSDEEDWVRCMLGCSYRQLGQFRDAETMFREITNKKRANEYAAGYAKWCLGYIDKRRIAKNEFQVIATEIETIVRGNGK